MPRRTDQRRAAVFALYQHDLTKRELDNLFESTASTFTRALAYATQDYSDDLDALIEKYAKGWTLDRIAPLEKAIMRVALLEILHPDAAPGDMPIPAEGAIVEAVETAKEFCGAEAPGFVNGILAAVLRGLGKGTADPAAPDAPRADVPAVPTAVDPVKPSAPVKPPPRARPVAPSRDPEVA